MLKLALAAAFAVAPTMVGIPASAATVFQLDQANSYIKVTSNQTLCVFGQCALSAALLPLSSFTLARGESYSFDFASLSVSSGFGGGTATIEAQLAFITPNAGPASNSADGQYIRLGGIFRPGALLGSLDWDNATQRIIASDGTDFRVAFGDLAGVNFGSEVFAPVTITLDSVPAVPEPMTWAMMMMGVGVLGASMRRMRAARRHLAFGR